MNEEKYIFIGWCHEDTHDKVWGVILLEPDTKGSYSGNWWNISWYGTGCKCVTFWGRRGRKLQTKITVDDADLRNLIRSKVRKGYAEVDYKKLNEVYPEFESDLKKTEFWSKFKI